MRRTTAVMLVVVVAACSGDDSRSITDASPPPDASPQPDASVPLVDLPLETFRNREDLDILFVVDDSGAMAKEQEALASALPALIAQLSSEPPGLPDVHVGVASSNVGTGPEDGGGPACEGDGDEGILQVAAQCPLLTDGARYIRDELIPGPDGARDFNYTGSLEDQLGCMVQLGVQGCGFEQHLEAMRRAVDNQVENAGFLRPDAMLLVIILADEDDCSAADRGVFSSEEDDLDAPLGQLTSFRCFEFGVSCAGEVERETGPRYDCEPDEDSAYMEKISDYVDALTELKGPRRVAIATITGPATPVEVGVEPASDVLWVEPACMVCPDGATGGCSPSPVEPDGALVTGFPGIRLRTFAAGFPIRSQQDICAFGNGGLDFTPALDAIGRHLVEQTATRCLTVAPADRDPDTAGLQAVCAVFDTPAEEAIPSCEGSAEPCFHLVDDPECTETQIALVIDRGDTAAPPDTSIVLRCAE